MSQDRWDNSLHENAAAASVAHRPWSASSCDDSTWARKGKNKHFKKMSIFLSKKKSWAIIFKWGNNDFFDLKDTENLFSITTFRSFAASVFHIWKLEILLGKDLKEIRDIQNDMHIEMPFISLFLKAKHIKQPKY